MKTAPWHDYIVEKINAAESLIKSMSAIAGAHERSASLRDAQDKLQEIQRKDFRQFKLEVRLVKDTNERRNFEKELCHVQIKHQAVKGYLASAKAGESRQQLLIGNEGDQVLAQASLIQDETQSSISNIKQMIAESKNVGTSSLEELHGQRKVIEKVGRDADKGSGKLSRSQKLIKQFQRGRAFFR